MAGTRDMAITIIDSTSVRQVEKVIRIKNISHSLLFALRRLGKARHCGVTDIVLATMREYALRLRVVDINQKREQDHTMLEQLDKFYLHRYPHPFPQYIMKDKTRISTRMGTFSLRVPAPLLDEVRRLASSRCFVFNDFVIKILVERMERELCEDPTLLLRYIPEY